MNFEHQNELFDKMKTILVTGGAGFIGSHTCEALLKEGYKVIAVDDFNDYYNPKFKKENLAKLPKNKDFASYKTDIRNFKALQKIFSKENIDIIIHLAARAGVRASVENPKLYIEVNVQGTLNLLELAVEYKAEKFVLGSSSSVYGLTEKIPFTENDPCDKPNSPYAATKRAAELLCFAFHQLYGTQMTILRFFTVYGPRGRPDMAIYKFTESIIKGEEISVYGALDSKRDYTYVSDIVGGILSSLRLSSPFEIINLGDSRPVELRHLISLIEKNSGKKAKLNLLPQQKGDLPITYADIAKARQLLSYNPAIKIERGIKLFIDWYKKERLKKK